eukprot:TRINITY_DN33624_c0_g1_i1.p1 TRINITY_DN33624_c0_g1~~TRINITY_DN33624_c0_g1_i1.p1  ORF type:complete len:114 (-),score=39.61 TRINITY_DN33624_c0_g1_i1:80-421(-)
MRAFLVAAIAASGLSSSFVSAAGMSMGALPPWWILSGVKPQGPDENLGSYSAITFTKEQQEQFACDKHGEVLDEGRNRAAVKALKEAKKAAAAQVEDASKGKPERSSTDPIAV